MIGLVHLKGNDGRAMWFISTNDYLNYLRSKGFSFYEEHVGFIKIGKMYTALPDSLVNMAIEITLKAQLEFDGSFFIAVLELLKEHNVSNKRAAYDLMKEHNIL